MRPLGQWMRSQANNLFLIVSRARKVGGLVKCAGEASSLEVYSNEGMGCRQEMFMMYEIRGKVDKPPPQLCLLGWTAIGRIGHLSQPEVSCSNAGYLHTFPSHVLTEDLISAEVCED